MPHSKNRERLPEERVQRFIEANGLIHSGDLIIVGVSGGADSICLLDILSNLREELGVRLHVAHLNHELRGAESRADAEFVAAFAKKLGIPATIGSREVAAYRREKRLSLEEAAREVRYRFFAELASKLGAAKVAVGHTASDQAETVLMHLIRGSGTRGLTGLQPETSLRAGDLCLNVVRPILTLSREETQEYCRKHGLTWHTDATNLLPETMRNRIRLELIPLLRKYNPEIEEAVIRTAAIARDDIAYIDTETMRLSGDVLRTVDGSAVLDKIKFLALPASLQRSLIRCAIGTLAGDLRNIEMTHIEDIMSIVNRGAGKKVYLPYGLVFITDYDRFILRKGEPQPVVLAPLAGEYIIKVPGKTEIPGWRIETGIEQRESVPFPDEGNFVAYFDFDETGTSLKVRGRRSGDRFQPLGMGSEKTVAEFLIDEKVPRSERPGIPVVTSDKRIVWLVGIRIDDRVKITPDTRRALRLKFERLP